MKKYFLGLLAVVMAVTFSSFTTGTKQVRKATATMYGHWYTVDATGTQLVEEIYDNTPVERFDPAIDAPCEETEGDLCVVGSLTELDIENDSVPAPGPDNDNYIFKEEN